MSTYEISKSSLLSLKAEILKKQEEVQKAKVENRIRLQREQKKPLELKNKNVENRAANDGDNIDEDLLKKSRSALEAKSKLYDKLSKGSHNAVENVYNSRYLVRFDKKALASNLPPEDDEEDTNPQSDDEFNDNSGNLSDSDWVEFVDSFGRTRTCLKQDLAAFKQKDREMRPRYRSKSPSPELQKAGIEATDMYNKEEVQEYNEESELLSGDMRRELLRQEWEREEQLLMDKDDLHYQDILFNEARTHGVGYYGFSKDEATRLKQQEALKNLRKETQTQQKLAQEIKDSREKQLAARIRAAKNRKRAREGLPPITSDDEEEEKRAEAIKIKEQEALEANAKQIRSKSQEKEDVEREKSRQMHVRPWDIGKNGVDAVESAKIRSGARDPYDQDEWNTIQRDKRVHEFAPPQSYEHANSVSRRKPKTKSPSHTSYERSSYKEPEHESTQSFAPSNVPASPIYNYGLGDTSKRPRTQLDMEEAIMRGLKYFRDKIEQSKNSDAS